MNAGLSPAFRNALVPVLLAIADDELIIGHRHSEWTGWAPHIEEDVAFSSIAQDEIGHAAVVFGMLSEITGSSVDQLVFGRTPGDYRHAQICERPNRDWAYTLARHFLYDTAERIRLTSLRRSFYKPLADVAEKLLREERYHELHADAWFRRLSAGAPEGKNQLALAMKEALPDAVGLFERMESEDEALEQGILPVPNNDLLQEWLKEVVGRMAEAQLPFQESSDFPSGPGGRRGKHSPDFDGLWDDLTRTYREEPAATW